MPKVTIAFNLPEEQNEYEITMKASDMYCAIENFQNYLRTEYKYKEHSEEIAKYLEEIREKWFEIMSGARPE